MISRPTFGGGKGRKKVWKVGMKVDIVLETHGTDTMRDRRDTVLSGFWFTEPYSIKASIRNSLIADTVTDTVRRTNLVKEY